MEALHRLRHEVQVRLAVAVITIDRLAPVALGGDEVDRAGEFKAKGRDMEGW